MSGTCAISGWSALLGVAIAVAPVVQAEEMVSKPTTVTPTAESAPTATPTQVPTPAQAVEPTAAVPPEQVSLPTQTPAAALTPEVSPTPARVVAPASPPYSPKGRSSGALIPLPPELQGDAVVFKAPSTKVQFLGKTKPIRIKPFLAKEIRLGAIQKGPGSVEIPLWLRMINPLPGFRFESLQARQNFSFLLVNEDAVEVPSVSVRCVWGLASVTGSLSAGKAGIEMSVPQGNVTLCELADLPGSEPWRLALWVGPPSSLIPPEFPSGGALIRGDIRYESTSTNAVTVNILGLQPTTVTGTFFTKEGLAIAAVERIGSGRVLIHPSVPAAHQPLFVAAGAALFVRDWQASRLEH